MEELAGQAQSQVTLVATVHQPNDILGELTRAMLPQLQALYGALVFLCSQTTSAEMLALLRDSRAMVHHERQPADESQWHGTVAPNWAGAPSGPSPGPYDRV